MKVHEIPLSTFLPRGGVTMKVDGELAMTTTTTLNTRFQYDDMPIKSYIYLPQKFQLPFRIDVTAKLDAPALHLIVGRGHVSFATGIMDNCRVTDILGNQYKPNSHHFDNDVPIGAYFDVSVTYGKKAMWISVNDELRCLSTKDQYIKAKQMPEEFLDGFNFAIACDKRTNLTIKSVTVTEYDEEPAAPQMSMIAAPPAPCLSASEKPTLQECIQGLTPDLQTAILHIDEFLLKDMKKIMAFKRKIEGGYPVNKITFVSPRGLSYKIYISDQYLRHDIAWISYNTHRERAKFGGLKKADYTVKTLEKLAETSPEFADEMAYRMKECVGCSKAGAHCMHREKYEYNGKAKISCGGGIHFKMLPEEFEDLRKWVGAVGEVLIAEDAK